MRCPKCSSDNYDSDYKCLICGHLMSPPSTPSVGLNDFQSPSADSSIVDVVETNPPSPDELDGNPILGLLICPQCGQRALFWNRHNQIYKCVDPKCSRKFTIDEYKNIEATAPQEEQQTEPIPSSVPMAEAKDEIIFGAPEQELFGVPTAEAKDEIACGTTEQIPSAMPTAEAKDETEHGTPEQIPSAMPTVETKHETEHGAPEQIPSAMPAAEAKNQVVCGPPERIPSLVLSAKAKDEIEYGTKAGKQLNRNLGLLLISVLAIVIVILAVFLWQKSSNLDGLSSQLNESRQALTESQTQLAASQQDLEELRIQLTEAQQEIEALQAEIKGLKPQLTPSEPFVYSGDIVGGGMLSFPIGLQKFERVEGRITGGLNGLEVQIQDPEGSIVEDLGRILQSNFMFTAQKSGVFTVVIREPSGLPSKYSLQYIIYQLQ